MGTFTTKLQLGGKAFAVSQELDPKITQVTVGQLTVIQRHPKAMNVAEWGEPVCEEQYMCFETGVGSGQVYTYGKTIFATEKEAEPAVIAIQQKFFRERAKRDERIAKEQEWTRKHELQMLEDLKRKYEVV